MTARKHWDSFADLAFAGLPTRTVGLTDLVGYYGTPGNDHFVGADGDSDAFVMSQGGDDYVEGLGSNDYFTYEATFDAGDQVIGGEGLNWLNLSDLAALKITGRMLTGVEGISVSSTIGKGAITLGREVTNENNFVSVVTSSNADYNIAFFATASMLDHALQATGRVSRFSGGGGRDYLGIWQDGDAIFNGGDGENRISFFNLKLGVTVDLSLTDRQAIGHGSVQLTNVQDITGTTEADTLRGSAANNLVVSAGGNDLLQGLDGDDHIVIGGDGQRPFATHAYADGGAGIDTIDFATSVYVHVLLLDRGYQDTGQGLYRLIGFENVSGGQYEDRIEGDARANTLYGSDGADTLIGNAGADVLYGDSYATITSLWGVDNPTSPEIEHGPGGADVLMGGAGNDILSGEGGDDRLAGDLGLDSLNGGDGADTFLYAAVGESRAQAVDTITDFGAGDHIDVSQIDPDTATPGDQAFHFGKTAGHTGDILVAFDTVAHVTSVTFYVDGDARRTCLSS